MSNPAPLPSFRYHPDPLKSGSVAASENECVCCGETRGYVYTVAPNGEEDIEEDSICPWCIADGSAHEKLGVEFTDANGIPDGTPPAAVKEIVERTPGYAAWQSEEWRSCCGDAAAFIAPIGKAELRSPEYAHLKDKVLAYLIEDGCSPADAPLVLSRLHRDKGPGTAYVFQCLHCGKYHFHVDVL